MSLNYWTTALESRLSRRRALAGSATAALSAAFLAACGGSKNKDSASSAGTNDKSGLLVKVEDTSKDAKPGGTWINPLAADILNLDPYGVTVGSAHAPWGYTRLVQYKAPRYRRSCPWATFRTRRRGVLGDVTGRAAIHLQASQQHQARPSATNKRAVDGH